MPIDRIVSPFDRKEQSVKAKANQTERKLARRLGGRVQPASGAIMGYKGDVKLHDFLIDSKETVRSSYSLTLNDLMKIKREADGSSREPALVISLQGHQWACIPLEVFEKMRVKDV